MTTTKIINLKTVFKASVIMLAVYFTALFIYIFLQIYTIGHIPSESMAPTFNVDDYVFANKADKVIRRGDIIVFVSSEGTTNGKEQYVLKRIIAVAGDTVTIENGKVFINDKEIKESYLPEGTYTEAGKSDKYVIPENCVFVLGDNRSNSFDSRYYENPFVSLDAVYGKVTK